MRAQKPGGSSAVRDGPLLAFMCGQVQRTINSGAPGLSNWMQTNWAAIPIENRYLALLQFTLARLRQHGFSEEQLVLIAGTMATQQPPEF